MISDKKLEYNNPEIEIYSLMPRVAILVGSVTTQKIVVSNDVTVEDYAPTITSDISF